MREIKFRGKDIESGEWLYGDLRQRLGYWPAIIESYCTDEGKVGYREVAVAEETVGQFTGLRDKNGKDIYEGDILRVKEFENLLMKEFSEDANRFDLFTLDEIKGEKRAEYISPVRWEEGGFDVSTNGEYFDMWVASLFGDMKRSSPVFDFEVIGNIYDNPNMIKRK